MVSQIPVGGTVRIEVTVDGGNIQVRVQNPLPTALPSGTGHHMAVANIEQRLMGLFGTRASLQVARAQNEYSVTMSYPVSGE